MNTTLSRSLLNFAAPPVAPLRPLAPTRACRPLSVASRHFLPARPTLCASSFLPPLARDASLHVAATPAAPSLRMSTATAEKSDVETYQFQAEVGRVMDIIIHSLYSHPEVFIRELVSNASDACDKRRYLSLTAAAADASASSALSASPPKIRVRAYKDDGVLVIQDNGVGMTHDELKNNLGSIATSGTKKFMEAVNAASPKGSKSDVTQIGQFGVGFYSAFLVADKVTLYTKSFADGTCHMWESTSANGYTITRLPADHPEIAKLEGPCGTIVKLSIKEGHFEFLENVRVNVLLQKFSEFVDTPIYGWDSKTEFDEEDEPETEGEPEAEGEKKKKRVPKTVEDWKLINEQKPIWLRRPKDVTQDEYSEFYKSLTKDFEDPAAHAHFLAEGDVEFRSIIFTPKKLPFELRQNMFDEAGRCMKLYVKRVFISDKFEGFLPRWLNFVRGVVDSEDLPLNVSREILQQSRVLRIISKRLIRKSIDMFKDIAGREDKEEYITFWKEFGRYIKAGIIDDQEYATDLSKLLRFITSKSDGAYTSFDEYISRMKDNQKVIYYLAADSAQAAENSPILEKVRSLGYEVVYLIEPIDEICFQSLNSYAGKRNSEEKENTTFRFVDIAKEDFELEEDKSEEAKEEKKKQEETFTDVTTYVKDILGEKVGKVRLSSHLTDSPSALVQSQFGVSPTMEKFMKFNAAQTQDPMMEQFARTARVLEINGNHPIVQDLKERIEAGDKGVETEDTAMLLYEMAMMTGGYIMDDVAGFAKRVAKVMTRQATAKPAASSSSSRSSSEKAIDPEIVD